LELLRIFEEKVPAAILNGGSRSEMGWIIGVAASVLGSACTAIGNISQKIAQMEQEELSPTSKYKEPIPGIVLSWKWFVGFFSWLFYRYHLME